MVRFGAIVWSCKRGITLAEIRPVSVCERVCTCLACAGHVCLNTESKYKRLIRDCVYHIYYVLLNVKKVFPTVLCTVEGVARLLDGDSPNKKSVNFSTTGSPRFV